MTSIRSRLLRSSLIFCLLGSFSWLGCDSSPDPAAPPELKEEDKAQLASALPSGVTLDSPIEANPMQGPNSKTVGEALTALHAHVKDGKIYDGGLGKVIQFQTGGKKPPKPKGVRGKPAEDTTTIVVTGG